MTNRYVALAQADIEMQMPRAARGASVAREYQANYNDLQPRNARLCSKRQNTPHRRHGNIWKTRATVSLSLLDCVERDYGDRYLSISENTRRYLPMRYAPQMTSCNDNKRLYKYLHLMHFARIRLILSLN
jgi:hypothetical protein